MTRPKSIDPKGKDSSKAKHGDSKGKDGSKGKARRPKSGSSRNKDESDSTSSSDGDTEETNSSEESDGSSDGYEKKPKRAKRSKKRRRRSTSDSSSDSDGGPSSKELGKIDLPKFNGEPEKFQQWWSEFKFLVHVNRKVKHVIKFIHLRRCLVERAQSYIQELAPSKNNYQKVIKKTARALRKHQHSERIVPQAHHGTRSGRGRNRQG